MVYSRRIYAKDYLMKTELGHQLVAFSMINALPATYELGPAENLLQSALQMADDIVSDIYNRRIASINTATALTWHSLVPWPFVGLDRSKEADQLESEAWALNSAGTGILDLPSLYDFERKVDKANVRATLNRQFYELLGAEFITAAEPYAALAAAGIEFVGVKEGGLADHLARHVEGSLTIGSKFTLPATTITKILEKTQDKIAGLFRAAFVDTGAVARIEFQHDYVRQVGTNALINTSLYSPDKIFEIVRDAGTNAESRVKVALVLPERMPTTSVVTFVAGPYGPTNKAGFYTAFPGNAAALFLDRAYWETHGFLATPAEVRATLQEMRDAGPAIISAISQEIDSMIKAAEAKLAAFEAPPPAPESRLSLLKQKLFPTLAGSLEIK